MSNDRSGNRRLPAAPLRRGALYVALAAALGTPLAAHAMEIPTGNEDLVVRWDNTVKYNIGMRTQSQDEAMLKNPNTDDGDRNFSNGSVVTNRFDVFSEFDVVYKRMFGARVSASGWYDFAYSNLDNTSTATSNTLVKGLPVAGALSPYTKRYAKGVSGEWLDAFVFANVDVGGIPINVKAGQHTVFWGDSLLLNGALHSVSYSQNSLDVWKGFATPGTEAKELFRPKGGITLQIQPVNELSIAGQWFYNWQAVRIPESGSYLTINDALQFGGDSLIFGANPFAAVPGSPALGRLWRGQDILPPTNSGSQGDWGVSARWSPAWLDGTLGFYYRNATDILPQLMVTPGLAALPSATCTAIGGTVVAPNACIINKDATNVPQLTQQGKLGLYNLAYGNDIKIMGVTLSKNIEGISVGAEFSYRENMPLQSNPVTVLPAALVPSTPGAIATTAVPSEGTPGARGNTYHGLINALGIIPKTPLFDTANYVAELTWMRWAKVTNNPAVFKGADNYTAIDAVSKDYFGLAVNFTPTWFQVFPGVDLLAPISWSGGISGNAAIFFGGNENAGNYAIGLAADIYQKYRVDLKYSAYYGDYTTNAAGAVTTYNGATAAVSDRGWISLTFKTTF